MTDRNNDWAISSQKSPQKGMVEVESLVKVGGWLFAIIGAVLTVVFWIQAQGADRYYPKIAGENLEKQLVKMEQKFDSLESGNKEIIRLLGRLEAAQERDDDR